MKNLLATSALALVAFAGAASAQSVLERVLSEIDNSTNLARVNGTFANIAENIGGTTALTVYYDANGSMLTADQYAASLVAAQDAAAAGVTVVAQPDAAQYDLLTLEGVEEYAADLAAYELYVGAVADARSGAASTFAELYEESVIFQTTSIDGSIANVVDGISEATQVAIANAGVSATEWDMPTFEFGDMATTVLGAVNTGEITLGVNQAVDEAKTTSTGALSSLVDQIGGSADTGAIVLNVASNMTGVNGSIRNTMTEVNGTVGNAATTVLGAVNTGTIVSGVNAAVSGIVSTGAKQTGGIATSGL